MPNSKFRKPNPSPETPLKAQFLKFDFVIRGFAEQRIPENQSERNSFNELWRDYV